jgi:phosphoribosylformimino-5-aminoimidazole carboxamide ribotide isomerase
MQLIPAIDIRDGRCVRLLRGDFALETRYAIDPQELARSYRRLGAGWLHVVDLDGAATGRPANLALLERIAQASDLNVQLGGGIRDRRALTAALASVQRVVIGSLAVAEPRLVIEWLEEFGSERIVLALDVRIDAAGVPLVTTHGWRETTSLSLWNALEAYPDGSIKHVLCTDVARDGALEGPNCDLYQDCARRHPELAWQASGGVRHAADLAALVVTGVSGAIAGKAMLEGLLPAEEIRAFLPNA